MDLSNPFHVNSTQRKDERKTNIFSWMWLGKSSRNIC